MNIHKMTVAELARESEDNKLLQGHIWTKACELEARCERYREALNKIASWSEGEIVTSGFDEPCSARIARTALEDK